MVLMLRHCFEASAWFNHMAACMSTEACQARLGKRVAEARELLESLGWCLCLPKCRCGGSREDRKGPLEELKNGREVEFHIHTLLESTCVVISIVFLFRVSSLRVPNPQTMKPRKQQFGGGVASV